MTPELQRQAMDDIAGGHYPANCQKECHWSFLTEAKKMYSLYEKGAWRDLVDLIVQVGHANDVTYYYLGQAAEGLGYPKSAILYYEHSIELSNDKVPHHLCENPAFCPVSGWGSSEIRLKALKQQAKSQGNGSQAPAASRPVKLSATGITRDFILNMTVKNDRTGDRKTYVNGRWTSSTVDSMSGLPEEQLDIISVALGDLNGDGKTDGAFVEMETDAGAPGHGVYLKAVLWSSGTPGVTKLVSLGDRIKVLSLSISKHNIYCTMLTRRPGQGMAAEPTAKVTRRFAYRSGALVEVSGSR